MCATVLLRWLCFFENVYKVKPLWFDAVHFRALTHTHTWLGIRYVVFLRFPSHRNLALTLRPPLNIRQ